MLLVNAHFFTLVTRKYVFAERHKLFPEYPALVCGMFHPANNEALVGLSSLISLHA
jgi:hypothetical protein